MRKMLQGSLAAVALLAALVAPLPASANSISMPMNFLPDFVPPAPGVAGWFNNVGFPQPWVQINPGPSNSIEFNTLDHVQPTFLISELQGIDTYFHLTAPVGPTTQLMRHTAVIEILDGAPSPFAPPGPLPGVIVAAHSTAPDGSWSRTHAVFLDFTGILHLIDPLGNFLPHFPLGPGVHEISIITDLNAPEGTLIVDEQPLLPIPNLPGFPPENGESRMFVGEIEGTAALGGIAFLLSHMSVATDPAGPLAVTETSIGALKASFD